MRVGRGRCLVDLGVEVGTKEGGSYCGFGANLLVAFGGGDGVKGGE
jgi:hypothetical protein